MPLCGRSASSEKNISRGVITAHEAGTGTTQEGENRRAYTLLVRFMKDESTGIPAKGIMNTWLLTKEERRGN